MVWRNVWGVMVLVVRLGQDLAAATAWTRSLAAIASRLIGLVLPWAVKTGLSG